MVPATTSLDCRPLSTVTVDMEEVDCLLENDENYENDQLILADLLSSGFEVVVKGSNLHNKHFSTSGSSRRAGLIGESPFSWITIPPSNTSAT